MTEALNLCNHRMKIMSGGCEYIVAIRSFQHKGKQLYQASVLEDYRINYQTQGERRQVFKSLKSLFSMYDRLNLIEGDE